MCACWQGWVMGENTVLSGFHLKQGQSAIYLGVWMRGEEGRRYNCSSHLVTVALWQALDCTVVTLPFPFTVRK